MKTIIIILLLITPVITETTPQENKFEISNPSIRVEKKLDAFNQDINELIYELNKENM